MLITTRPHTVAFGILFFIEASLGLIRSLQTSYSSFTASPLVALSEPLNYGFNWSTITPTKELKYHDCYDEFKCTRLLVPENWLTVNQSTDGNPDWHDQQPSISIGIIKYPAAVSYNDSRYAGGVLINPGGPGGSGVQVVQAAGSLLQEVINSPDRQFDIIGFDPRGVGLSGPDSRCWGNEDLRKQVWSLLEYEDGIADSNNHAISTAWARAQVYGQTCHNRGQVGRFMTTPSVARDMLEIVERMEEEKQKALQAMKTSHINDATQQPIGHDDTRTEKHQAKLQYIGFSYGTVLGNVFASMYPDRVERMVLDGVVDVDDYMTASWSKNLQDTDKDLNSFYEYCFGAGHNCDLYDKDGPSAIKRNLEGFLKDLRHTPIAAVDPSGQWSPKLITYSNVKSIIFSILYNPIGGFPVLATLIDQLQRGDYSQFLMVIDFLTNIDCSRKDDDGSVSLSQPDATRIIVCSDGQDVSNDTVTDLHSYLKLLQSQSYAGGGLWTALRTTCTGWRTRPDWRFTGPYGGKTATPILWVGNTADPVTPIRNAHAMSKLFPGSRVIQHDAGGHCSLFNGPGECILEAYRKYFQTGKLPKEGTVCPPSTKPFQDSVLHTRSEMRFTDDLINLMHRRHYPLGV